MFDGPEGAEHKHKTGHHWADFAIAGAALLVSVVSLTVAVLHGRTMEQMADANSRMVQANSWPSVGAILSREDKAVTIGLTNDGVGPAKVHWVEVDYDGKPMSGTQALMQACCGYDPALGKKLNFGWDVADNTVLRAGAGHALITFPRASNPPALHAALFRNLLKVNLHICYCSVFDECFISDGQSLDPKPVKICPAPPPHPFDPLK